MWLPILNFSRLPSPQLRVKHTAQWNKARVANLHLYRVSLTQLPLQKIGNMSETFAPIQQQTERESSTQFWNAHGRIVDYVVLWFVHDALLFSLTHSCAAVAWHMQQCNDTMWQSQGRLCSIQGVLWLSQSCCVSSHSLLRGVSRQFPDVSRKTGIDTIVGSVWYL